MTFQPIRPGNYTHSLRRCGGMEEYRDDPSGQTKMFIDGNKEENANGRGYLAGWRWNNAE